MSTSHNRILRSQLPLARVSPSGENATDSTRLRMPGYGAWAQLLVLFRLIYDGAESGEMRLPERHGVLFDPDRFKFLEGRPSGGARQIDERVEPPLVPDGTVYRALEKLLVLDGEICCPSWKMRPISPSSEKCLESHRAWPPSVTRRC